MHHSEVRWPSGFLPTYKQIQASADVILTGTIICIDPSSGGSSLPGFAIAKAGEIITSGTVDLGPTKALIYERLQILHDRVSKLTPEPPDLFCLEMIRGQNFSHHYLLFSCGVTIAAARTARVLELPMHFWRPVAKITPGYIKGDAMDAECMAMALILVAQKFKEESQETAS